MTPCILLSNVTSGTIKRNPISAAYIRNYIGIKKMFKLSNHTHSQRLLAVLYLYLHHIGICVPTKHYFRLLHPTNFIMVTCRIGLQSYPIVFFLTHQTINILYNFTVLQLMSECRDTHYRQSASTSRYQISVVWKL